MNYPGAFFANDPNDTEDIRLEKIATFLVAGSCILAGSLWATMYYAIFGWGILTLLPICFIVIVGGVMFISHFSHL